MRAWARRIGLTLLVMLGLGLLGGAWWVKRQGIGPGEWAEYRTARVEVDAHGIPTIRGSDWAKVVEAQGYVLASDRYFHMDLLRRAAGGRLAEVFGQDLVPLDTRRRQEDWLGTADRAWLEATPEERDYLEAYARGVNDYLNHHGGRVGIEYTILGISPEPWSPRDSLLVLMLMCEQLATSAPGEALSSRWQDALPAEWYNFLFPTDHPWNQPLFGEKPRDRPALPERRLPNAPITAARTVPTTPADVTLADLGLASSGEGASNNWGWCRGEECYLANDPHLAATVPHLWYALRLQVAADDWVVGVALPGIPGVTLGMNPHLAWAFTNVGEDVDDYLKETLSEDGQRYVLRVEGGQPVWADVEARTETIRVKGGAEVQVTRRRTARGPLGPREHLSGEYARKWLPLLPGTLHIPTAIHRAKNWDELNLALDQMKVPAQNVLMLDRQGNLGYRASGTGIDRRISGRRPQPAIEGDWLGLLPPETRPRLYYYVRGEGAVSSTVARSIATANERIWVDTFGHGWAQDLRKDRIRRVLESKDHFSQEEMSALQLDTQSRAHQLLLRWIAERARVEGPEVEPLLGRWKAWDGDTGADPATYTEAIEAQDELMRLCLERVRAQLLPADAQALPYETRQPSAWMITMLEDQDGPAVFGLDPDELADHLVKTVLSKAKDRVPHPLSNRWRAQHPLAKVPVIGAYFAVDEPPQRGSHPVPRVEAPKYGASTRLVWNLAHPEESTWITPVGQSGHLGSPHYRDLQPIWHAGQTLKVLPPGWRGPEFK